MPTGFVFPGQGSQSVGMCNALADAFPVVKETFDEASSALGLDLWVLVSQGPETELNKTENTQPAMLTAGVATWRVWQQQGGAVPDILAGHSLGEYSALVCAGALTLADAATLVADRGRYMQSAVAEGAGAMAAILGLDDNAVKQACIEAAQGEVVEAVNFNAPGQVVIAGSSSAVKRATDAAKAAGAKRAVILPVSVPSHCALMMPAAEKLAARLADISVQAPTIPVINNVDVASVSDAAAIKDALVRQLHHPVRWVETIQSMASQGINKLVECGPGKVLIGLNKRIDRSMTALPVIDTETLNAALAEE